MPPKIRERRKSDAGPARRHSTRRESDRFFRRLVGGMRNGVFAITRDGNVAEINGEAARIFQIKRSPHIVGRHFSEVLAKHPDMVRVLNSTFELSHLPNRAELRLKTTGKVIGYTLSHVRDEHGRSTGIALFFKDLTKVEQLEERERLRDRLVALGEMAAAIAHEVKNPLAGIEVMAGLLKRQAAVADSPDAQSLLNDIISEAKMANQIVHEALEFVRPIRLQVEHTAIADVLQNSVSLAETKVPRRAIGLQVRVDDGLPPIQGDHHQLCQLFTNLLINAFEALEGRGAVDMTAREGLLEEELQGTGRRRRCDAHHRGGSRRQRPGRPEGAAGSHFQRVLHNQAAGFGARPGDRSQGRRRARRTHRHSDRRARHAVSSHATGLWRQRLVRSQGRIAAFNNCN